MLLQINNENDFGLSLSAEIIHTDSNLLIIAVPIHALPHANNHFWSMCIKTIIFPANNRYDFIAESWTHSDIIYDLAIIKFYKQKQSWFV